MADLDFTGILVIPITIGVVIGLAGVFFKRFGDTSEAIVKDNIRLKILEGRVDEMTRDFKDLSKNLDKLHELFRKLEVYEYRLNDVNSKLDKLLNQRQER